MAPRSFLPALDSNSLTYLSIILFNFMGFEVITTYVGSMENPNKQIPRAIIAGGIAIAALYLFSSFGIGAAIPAMDISLDSGIMDAVGIMAGVGSVLFIVVGIVFLITLFGNMVSWSFGVNFVAEHAARKKNMPKVFAHESKKNQMPTGAAIVNGVVASVLVLLSPVMELAGFDGFFWIFFSMNIVFLLISYIPMFPAFLKLRTIDPAANRVFKVPGGRGVALVVAWVPVILLVLAIIATIVPLNGSPEEMSKIPMLIGVIAFVILGELVRIWSARGRKDDYGGMGSSGDPFEFDVAHGYEEMPESEKIAVEEDLLDRPRAARSGVTRPVSSWAERRRRAVEGSRAAIAGAAAAGAKRDPTNTLRSLRMTTNPERTYLWIPFTRTNRPRRKTATACPASSSRRSASGCCGRIAPTTGATARSPRRRRTPTWRAASPSSSRSSWA